MALFTADARAPCPFGPGLCRANNTHLVLDTGLLDSHQHFGINGPPEERLKYRKVLRCAPLVTEGYKVIYNQSFLGETRTMAGYLYGDSPLITTGLNQTWPDRREITFVYLHNSTAEYLMRQRDGIQFTLSLMDAKSRNGTIDAESSYFIPIPGLTNIHPGADYTILFLSSNGGPFLAPVYDDWYRTTSQRTHNMTSGIANTDGYPDFRITLYYQDEPASPLGCVEQAQYCIIGPNGNPICTPLSSWWDIMTRYLYELPGMLVNGNESAKLSRLFWFASVLLDVGFTWPIQYLQANVLQSRFSRSMSCQGPLPANQWQIEVKHMFATALANLQHNVINSIALPNVPYIQNFTRPPLTDAEQDLCRSQKIRSTAYASFSVFDLACVATFGGLVIAISYLIEPIIACLHRRGKFEDYPYYEWASNSTFQLQRLAHQGAGAGTWSGGRDEIPFTVDEEKLGLLDFSDRKLPILRPVRKEGLKTQVMTSENPASADASANHNVVDQAPPTTLTTPPRDPEMAVEETRHTEAEIGPNIPTEIPMPENGDLVDTPFRPGATEPDGCTAVHETTHIDGAFEEGGADAGRNLGSNWNS